MPHETSLTVLHIRERCAILPQAMADAPICMWRCFCNLCHYRAPSPGEPFETLSLIEIVEELRATQAHLLQRCDYRRFGVFLQSIGLEKMHTRSENRYKIVRVHVKA